MSISCPLPGQEAIFPPWYQGELQISLGPTAWQYQGKSSLDPAQPQSISGAIVRINQELPGVFCSPLGLLLVKVERELTAFGPLAAWPTGFLAGHTAAEVRLPSLRGERLVRAQRVDLGWPEALPLAQRQLAASSWVAQQSLPPNTTAQWQLAPDGQTLAWQIVETLEDIRLVWWSPTAGWALLRVYGAAGAPYPTPGFIPWSAASSSPITPLLAWGFPQTTSWRQPSAALTMLADTAPLEAQAAIAEALRQARTLEGELRGVLKTLPNGTELLPATANLINLYQQWRPWWMAHQAYRQLLNAPSGWFRYSDQRLGKAIAAVPPTAPHDSLDALYLQAYFATMPAQLLPKVARELAQNHQKNYAQLLEEVLKPWTLDPQVHHTEWSYFFGALVELEQNTVLPNYRNWETQIAAARLAYFRALAAAFPERNFAPNADGHLRCAQAQLSAEDLTMVGMATAQQAVLINEQGQLLGFAGSITELNRDLAQYDHHPQTRAHPWYPVATALGALQQEANGQLLLRELASK